MSPTASLLTISHSKEGSPVAHIGALRLDRDNLSAVLSAIEARQMLLHLQSQLSDVYTETSVLTQDPEISDNLLLEISETPERSIILSSPEERVELASEDWNTILSLVLSAMREGVAQSPREIQETIAKNKRRDRIASMTQRI